MNKDTRPVMVSVRCLTYNHYNYLRQCLDSFLMQKTDFRFFLLSEDNVCDTMIFSGILVSFSRIIVSQIMISYQISI